VIGHRCGSCSVSDRACPLCELRDVTHRLSAERAALMRVVRGVRDVPGALDSLPDELRKEAERQ
jgi:hypothetical protein